MQLCSGEESLSRLDKNINITLSEVMKPICSITLHHIPGLQGSATRSQTRDSDRTGTGSNRSLLLSLDDCATFAPYPPMIHSLHLHYEHLILTTYRVSRSIEKPRRISKVCCALQQRLHMALAEFAALWHQQCLPDLRQNLPQSHGSCLALAAAIARGLHFRRGRSVSFCHFCSGRKRV